MVSRVDWSKEKSTAATFKSYAKEERMLKVYLHEQETPIQCSSGHKGDFARAVQSVQQLTDGQPIVYQSRGVNTYSPSEWFYRIDPAESAPNLDSGQAPKRSLPPFKQEEKSSQKVYGPPGTGKTYTMMQIIKKRLAEGVKPDEICFISYTNVAANEAIDRAAKEFDEYDADDFPYFKTIHALATALGGLEGKRVMSNEDLERFDKTILSTPVWTEKGKAESVKIRSVHPCLTLRSLASARKTRISEQINAVGYYNLNQSVIYSCKENQWLHPPFLSTLNAVEFWMRRYVGYKLANNYVDYDDVIRKVLNDDFDTGLLRFKLLIIDEAQDCSDFMWDFLKLMIKECKEVYICGDDDQAIMDGFGANSQAFLEIETTEQDRILDKSYRLNQVHHGHLVQPGGALSIVKRFKEKRKEKAFTHNGSQDGLITDSIVNDRNYRDSLSLESLARIIQLSPNEEWLVMAPTRQSVDEISQAFLHKGIPHFKSNEPQYIGDGVTVQDIRVQTIHTSKGAEADNVAVVLISLTDAVMYRDEASRNFNPTLRYVAESRARMHLYIVDRAPTAREIFAMRSR